MSTSTYRNQILSDLRLEDENLDAGSQEFMDLAGSDEKINALIDVLADKKTTKQGKLEAIQRLNVVSNFSPVLPTRMPEYINAMRGLLDDDDKEVMQQAYCGLAAIKDEIVQKRLLVELTSNKIESERAIPTHKAISLLGFDEKAISSKLLLDIAKNPPDEESLVEAVRYMPADKESLPFLIDVMVDESKPLSARSLIPGIVNNYDPLAFLRATQKILENTTETTLNVLASYLAQGVTKIKLSQSEEQLEFTKKAFQKLVENKPELVNDTEIHKVLTDKLQG